MSDAALGGGFEPSHCGICRLEGPPRRDAEIVIAESPRWIVRHHAAPAPLAGWALLCARRHVQGPARFEDDDEAAEFGVALRDVTRAIERTTGALRVYTIMFGEGAQHVHAHCIPRLRERPDLAAWKVADLYRAIERGEAAAAREEDVRAMIERIRAELVGAAGGRWR